MEYLSQFPGDSNDVLRNISGLYSVDSFADPASEVDGAFNQAWTEAMLGDTHPVFGQDPNQPPIPEPEYSQAEAQDWSAFGGDPEDVSMEDQWSIFIRDFGILDTDNQDHSSN